jgi:pimeloyl-ACP methyl ester carboxylesterase
LIVPSHPGFGASELPGAFTAVEDLAYLYLDLFDVLGLTEVILVGVSFGGWIAAQIAVMNSPLIRTLVLVDALGIKTASREQREIADMHALPALELDRLMYCNPHKNRPSLSAMNDEDLLTVARNRESFTLFGWRPYMHDPKLRGRLARIKVPSLVLWGLQDGVVPLSYGEAYSRSIPGSLFETVDRAGHYPEVEQPEVVAGKIAAFLQLNAR